MCVIASGFCEAISQPQHSTLLSWCCRLADNKFFSLNTFFRGNKRFAPLGSFAPDVPALPVGPYRARLQNFHPIDSEVMIELDQSYMYGQTRTIGRL
jgi:hypothetical protein